MRSPGYDDRYVNCIRCAHAVSWLEHTMLRTAVDCPRCGAKNQFGPGVYVDDFRGYTLLEVLHRKTVAEARMKGSTQPQPKWFSLGIIKSITAFGQRSEHGTAQGL